MIFIELKIHQGLKNFLDLLFLKIRLERKQPY